jgi:myo-inositol 2-dehydrogenase / D-chiro-inositol 1-dehydrogenase
MSQERVRVGVIGCGRMGKERARCAAASGALIAFVADADATPAEQLAAEHTSARALRPQEVDWSTVEAVFICTPPAVRQGLAEPALRAGVAVFVEKPIGLSAADADVLYRLTQDRASVNAVGYMNRYRSTVLQTRAAVQSRGALGLVAWWACPPYQKAWWSREQLSGGPINEQATHLIDLCRFIAGDVRTVCAVSRDSSGDGSTTLAAALEFDSGAIASLFYSSGAVEKHIGLDVVTRSGIIGLRDWNFRMLDGADTAGEESEDIFLIETGAFLDAVRLNSPSLVRCSFADALETQKVVDRIRAAAAETRGRVAAAP